MPQPAIAATTLSENTSQLASKSSNAIRQTLVSINDKERFDRMPTPVTMPGL